MSDQLADGLPLPRRLWATLAILLATFLITLDSSIANVALPTIAADLQGTPAQSVWVVSGYQLATAVFLLPMATVGERVGAKRMYVAGTLLFTAASLACAISPTLDQLVTARIFQGFASACASVVGVVLMRLVFPARLLGRAISLFGLTVAISAALGPTVAAAILAIASWRWLFAINVPIAAIALAFAVSTLPESARHRRPFDTPGALLNGIGISALIVGVDWLGGSPVRGGLVALAGLAVLGFLLWHQRGRSDPLIPLDLVRIPLFSLSFFTSVCSYTAQSTAYVSLPFFFQHGLGFDEVKTGLFITPWPLVIVVVAPVSGWLSDRYPAGILSSFGLFCLAGGLVSLAFLPSDPSPLAIIWRMVLCGVGFGMFQTPNNRAIVTAGPVSRTGAASGMMSQARLLGTTLGAAVVAVGFSIWGGVGATAPLLLAGAGFAAVGASVSLSRLAV